ncbi:MAG: D-alanine--D-alanine ligase [Chitinophagales bacterium]|nr:D-alanine--D-alanine ligase [Chitinophagales bacterium]
MNSKKLQIAIVTGGTSAEVEIALKGADVVIKHLDKDRFETFKINIGEKLWTVDHDERKLPIDKNDFSFIVDHKRVDFDCAFVIIHGKPAENGKIQAYFDLVGLPYTCSGVFASSISYNKEACKAFLKDMPVKLAKSITVNANNDLASMNLNLSFPVFVKPNQEGSSYGISRVKVKEDISKAVQQALKYDDQVMIEEAIAGREITCGLMTLNGEVITLPLTEIISAKEFFDYEAKYEGASNEITPAEISSELSDECKRISIEIYKKLMCKGIVRIDYILKDEDFYLLEVNSIPGLSEASIVPQQAKAQGISLEELFAIQIEECLSQNYQQTTI